MATSVMSNLAPQPKQTGIKELLDAGVNHVPDAFVLPAHRRDRDGEVTEELDVPIIDLFGCDGERRAEIVDQIGRASDEWGFFKVLNHGVDLKSVYAAALKFYDEPTEEKKRFPERDDGNGIAFMTGFNLSAGEARDWKDGLALWRRPGICDGMNSAPETLREATVKYVAEMDKLAAFLYDAIFESLGLSQEYRKSALPNIGRLLLIYNFYPPCPDPSKVRGVSPHSDISSFTILLQDEIPGLQVRKDDKWVPIKPNPDALVINIADQIEILSNGKYRSVEHRATAPSQKLRISLAGFYGPSEETVIAPLPALTDDENNPPKFNPVRFSDYLLPYHEKKVKCYKTTLNFAGGKYGTSGETTLE